MCTSSLAATVLTESILIHPAATVTDAAPVTQYQSRARHSTM